MEGKFMMVTGIYIAMNSVSGAELTEIEGE